MLDPRCPLRPTIRALPAFALAMLAPVMALAAPPFAEPPYPDLDRPPPEPAPAPLQVASPASAKPAPREEERSLVNLIRVDAALMYFRGSKLVGSGTRAY